MISHLLTLAAALLLLTTGGDAQAGRISRDEGLSITAKSRDGSHRRQGAERRRVRREDRSEKHHYVLSPRDGKRDKRPNGAVPEPAAGVLFPLGALLVSRSLRRRK